MYFAAPLKSRNKNRQNRPCAFFLTHFWARFIVPLRTNIFSFSQESTACPRTIFNVKATQLEHVSLVERLWDGPPYRSWSHFFFLFSCAKLEGLEGGVEKVDGVV